MKTTKVVQFLQLTIFTILLVSLFSYAANRMFQKQLEASLLERAKTELEDKDRQLSRFVERLKADLLILERSQLQQRFLSTDQASEQGLYRELLTDLAYGIVRSSGELMQLRYIDESGMERIRVDRPALGEDPYVVAEQALQNKHDRYYFRDTMALSKGQFFISRIDLNVEHGQIERPITPTLRVGMPLFIEGRQRGMLIINAFAKELLANLHRSSSYQTYLVDGDGHFLLNDSPAHEWSRYLDKPSAFPILFPENSQKILRRDEYIDTFLYSRRTTVDNGEGLHLIARVRPEIVSTQLHQLMWQMLLFSLAALLLALPVGYWLSVRFARLNELFRTIMASMGEGILVVTRQQQTFFANRRAGELLNGGAEELQQHSIFDLIPSLHDRRQHGQLHPFSTRRRIRPSRSDDGVMETSDRRRLSVSYSVSPVFVDNRYFGSVMVFEDITARKTMEEQVNKLSKVATQIDDLVLIADTQGVIEFVNAAYERQIGYRADELIGQHVRILKSGQHNGFFYKRMWKTLLDGKVFRSTMTNQRKNGSLYYEEKTITPLRDSSGQVVAYVSTGKDITQHIESLQTLDRLATTDPLTGIYNRRSFTEMLQSRLRRVEQCDMPLSLLMFDIDHFKAINDNYGHDVGDRVIVGVARLTQGLVRKSDLFARWGGEEFILGVQEAELESVMMIADKLRAEIEACNFDLGRSVTVSIGVASYSPGDSLDELLIRVDKALYRAKNGGRNCVCCGVVEPEEEGGDKSISG